MTDYPKSSSNIFEVMVNRRSQRIFTKGEVDIRPLLEAVRLSPSSCNRQAITVKVVSDQDEKNLLTGILVGGIGWVHRADKILLLFADPLAYKSPYEKAFMPWLDAGVCIQSIYLVGEALGLGTCYVNPNIRETNKQLFKERFGDKIYCGAVVVGYYDRKAIAPAKRKLEEVYENRQ